MRLNTVLCYVYIPCLIWFEWKGVHMISKMLKWVNAHIAKDDGQLYSFSYYSYNLLCQ
jgi:hypothetical protein